MAIAQDGARGPAGSERLSVDDRWPKLYRQLRRPMGRMLYRYRIPLQDGEDLIQTALLIAISKWAEIRDPVSWVVTILKNLCIGYWRKQRLKAEHYEPLDEIQTEPVIEAEQERRMLLADLGTASRGLSAAQRRLLVLRFQLGLDALEAAEVMGLAHGSMRKTTNRMLERLRHLLDAAPPRRAKPQKPPGGAVVPAAWIAALDAYLAASGLAAYTRGLYRYHLIAAGAVLGGKALADLAQSDLASYRAALLRDGRATGTHVNALNAARGFLLWARGQGLHSVEAEVIRITLRGWLPAARRRRAAGGQARRCGG